MSFRVAWKLVCDGGLHRTLPRSEFCAMDAGPTVAGDSDVVCSELRERVKRLGWKTMRSGLAGEMHLCPRCAELNKI